MDKSKLIKKFSFHILTNTEFDETARDLVPVLNKITIDPLPTLITAFAQQAAEYSAAVKQQRISPLTEEIQLIERNRDHTYNELHRDIANELHSADPATRAAAHELDVILRTFGNPTKLPMKDETNILRDICTRLTDSSMAVHLSKLPIAKALTTKLQTLNNQFETLYAKRIAEHDHKEIGIVHRLRKALEPALNLLISQINGYILIYGDTGLAAAVAAANSILTDSEQLAHRRAGHRHHEEGEGGQPATGQTAPSGEQQ